MKKWWWPAEAKTAYDTMENLFSENTNLAKELINQEQKIKNLDEQIDLLNKQIEERILPTEGSSTVTFTIDEELQVGVKSEINRDSNLKLIDSEYLTVEDAENDEAIQLAYILLINEATDQIIEDINSRFQLEEDLGYFDESDS